jgi:TetR/AcrR family transcriptional repressor of nem operon
MNGRAQQKEATRTQILASASRLLRERGIAGTNVADVMGGAGLTVGGFYAHFESKQALVEATLRGALRASRVKLRRGLEAMSPQGGVEAFVARYLSAAHRDDAAEGCPLPAVTSEIATTERAYAKALAAELFAAARLPDGIEPSGISSRSLALGLAALLVGGLSLARALRGTPLSDEVLSSARRFGQLAVRALVGPTKGRRHSRGDSA